MSGLFLLLILLDWGNAAPTISAQNQSFPPKWDLVPGSLSDFRTQNGKIVINPWDYVKRMGMYKLLLNVTEPYLDMNEQGNQRNILWGLPLQHGWQQWTGRLADKTTGLTCGPNSDNQTCISEKSWWACMNYYLSVVPFLAALDAGLLQVPANDIHISHPEEHETDFCYSVTDCKSAALEAMNKWKNFFEFIKASETSVPPASKKEDQFLTYMWGAHVESINAGLSRCSKRLRYLSTPERNFGEDWATAVDFIAATNFPTNFTSTSDFQIFLPHRKLVDGDKVPFIADFSEKENRVIYTLQMMNKANKYTGGLLLKSWKKAMCSDEARIQGRKLLQNMVNDLSLVPLTMASIMLEMLKNITCK